MLSEAALERRKNYLTASDVPSILGINPFRTPLAVWADKTSEEIEQVSNEAIEFGNDFEPALIQMAARRARLTGIIRNQWRVCGDGPGKGLLAATLDAVGMARNTNTHGIEAKTSGILNPGTDLDDWGDDGTSQVPDRVNVQCQIQMLCADIEVVYVAALLGRKGPRLYTLDRDEKAIGFMAEFAASWWVDHVKSGKPPAVISSEDNKVVRYLTRLPGKATTVDFGLVNAWLTLKETAKRHQEDADKAEAELKLSLGDAEIGTCPQGTFKYLEENGGDRIDSKALKENHPEIYKQVAKPSTRRVPRWKATK